MNGWPAIRAAARGAALAGCAGLLACSVRAQTDAGTVIQGLRLPLNYHPNGKIRSQIFAESANVPAKGEIVASKVRIEIYRDDGTVEATVTTERCVYSRENQWAESETAIRMERGGLTITGVGFRWEAKDERFQVLKDVRVTLNRRSGVGDMSRMLAPWDARHRPGEGARNEP